VTGRQPVVVPVLLPLSRFHRLDTSDPGYTGCGLAVHGWYGMTETQARDNADHPCTACFSTEPAPPPLIPKQRIGGWS
jgi:hypothetical protein